MPFVDFLLAVEAILNLRVRFGKGDNPIASATDLLVGIHDGANHQVLRCKGLYHGVHYT